MIPAETIINVVGFVFGFVWVWINVYQYYPLAKSTTRRLIWGSESPSRKREQESSDSVEEAREKATDGGEKRDLERPLTFDVLLPAYEEGDVIENSIASVRNASYDQDSINLVVLTEPGDDETTEALNQISERYDFTELRVPESYPGDPNKPRALNYGFDMTDGDVVSVIDAENVFDSAVFESAGERFLWGDVDFVQARLDMVNEDDGWLNTLFRAEYSYWYQLVFPPFFEVDYPIPMGGTTCFFRRRVLERISEVRRERYGDPWSDAEQQWIRESKVEGSIPWDPENVTEDFELGLFLWQNDFEPDFIHAPATDEESPLTLDSWMDQRTRWQKGKVYTLLHYIRNQPDTNRERIHLYTQTGMPHLGVINIVAVFLVLLASNLGEYDWYLPTWVLLVAGLVFLGVTMGAYGLGYWLASNKPFTTRLRRTGVVTTTVPLYWMLHWIADLRAFAQTYRGEFHWAKTAHAGRNVLSQAAPTANDEQSHSEKLTLTRVQRLAGLCAITGIAIATRLYELDGWSLFNDELYSIGRASLSFPEMLFVVHDTHPPLYYLSLHLWMETFGNSTASVRSLTVVFSVGTVIAVYYLGRELYDDRAGLAAALVTALSVYQVHYGQNARMYSLMAFFAAVSWYGFARIQSDPHRGSLVYGPATALLVYTHLYAVFVVLAQNIYMLLTERQNAVSWRRWLRLQLLVAFSATPVIAFNLQALVSDARGPMNLVDWLAPPTLYDIVELLRQFIGVARQYPLIDGTSYSHLIAIFMVFVYSIFAFTAVVRISSEDGLELTDLDSAGQMALLMSVPVGVPFVLSYLFFPMFFYRYAIAASLGLYILVGKGIANLDRQWLTVTALVLVVLASAGMLADHYSNGSIEPVDDGVQCLDDSTTGDDPILVQTFWGGDPVTETPLKYYDVFSEGSTHSVPPPENFSDRDGEAVRSFVDDRDQVWLFMYAVGDEGGQLREWTDDNPLFEMLEGTHDRVTLLNTTTINVYRFDRANESDGGERSSVDQCSEDGSENTNDGLTNGSADRIAGPGALVSGIDEVKQKRVDYTAPVLSNLSRQRGVSIA